MGPFRATAIICIKFQSLILTPRSLKEVRVVLYYILDYAYHKCNTFFHWLETHHVCSLYSSIVAQAGTIPVHISVNILYCACCEKLNEKHRIMYH